MSMTITGLGTASPRYSIAQSDACDFSYDYSCDTPEQRRLMKAIYRRSGVREKGSVLLRAESGSLADREDFFQPRQNAEDFGPGTAERMTRYHQEALPLGLRASQNALAEAGVAACDVTHLVTASCSGFSAPGFDIGLVQELGLPPGTPRTHVGFMGCHAGLNALRVAGAYTGSEPNAVVLVCCVELCSLHHTYGWNAEKVVANSLFADGAGAAVCRSDSVSLSAPYRVLRHGTVVVEGTADAMTWQVGDHGFAMTLSQKVPNLIEQHLAPWMHEFLAAQGHCVESIGAWAIHPGGPRILDACRAALQIEEEQLSTSREILARHGNMSSATMFFLLDLLRRENERHPIVSLGFGPGLTIEAMLLA